MERVIYTCTAHYILLSCKCKLMFFIFLISTVTAGMSDTFVFPPENVTTFDSYSFFVNEINFNDSPVGNIFIGAK